MVPAYTAAAFAKKLARLALKAPPAGAMLAIGFIHNIIRRCDVLGTQCKAALVFVVVFRITDGTPGVI